MNKKTSLFSKIFLALATAVTISAGTLRIYIMQTAFNPIDGFYTNDTLHAVLGYGLAAFVVIAAACAYIYIKEEKSFALPECGILVKGASVLAGCALCGFIIYSFAKAVIPSFGGIGIADVAMMALSAVAMLYFFTADKKGDFRALLCISSALVLLAMVLGLYFNSSISYINHSIVLCFAAAIFTMLAFAAEANFALGRPAYRRYLSYAPSAAALSLTVAIPDIVYFITSKTAVISNIYFDILFFAFGIYHLARLTEIAVKKV